MLVINCIWEFWSR